MMKGCAWTIGVIVAIVVGVAMFGPAATVTPKQPLDVTKPVYLAKDAVECSVLAALFTYSHGQQAGGEAEGHRAVADLFVHPTESCYRVAKRERVRVLDATTSDHAYVKTKCVLSLLGKSDDCYVRPRDLEN
jgi:hypothetical protein